ncbi:MAG: hypothetical protein ACXAE3_08005 [Candidatus Kariarchaeaceae archaeon]
MTFRVIPESLLICEKCDSREITTCGVKLDRDTGQFQTFGMCYTGIDYVVSCKACGNGMVGTDEIFFPLLMIVRAWSMQRDDRGSERYFVDKILEFSHFEYSIMQRYLTKWITNIHTRSYLLELALVGNRIVRVLVRRRIAVLKMDDVELIV